jgi:tetratricopeptide (TPR) repeat protein
MTAEKMFTMRNVRELGAHSLERAGSRNPGRAFQWALFGLVGLLLLVGTGCEKLRARDQLNKGVQSYKNAKYADAVEHFKQAIALDPTYNSARLYLATAYMVQWIPGAESPENLEFANKAKDEFNEVLKQDPNDKNAMASLAFLSYNQAQSLPADQKAAKYDEAADWYHKLLAIDPTNKEAYYTLGVISYAKWYPALMLARANLRMKPEDPGPLKDKKVKEELKEKYSGIIDDGIGNLQKAIDVDKEYDDAMAYMNLLVRERADLLDSSDEYKKQIEVADNWLQKALDTKKIKAARQPGNAGGIVNDAK